MTKEIEESTVQRSVDSILRHQSGNGAIIASSDFAQYHFSWLRDGSFCAFALDQAGEHDASARFHSWVNDAVEGIANIIDGVIEKRERGEVPDPLHMPPARFALDGSVVVDGWPNFQIDGYGTWLWSLGQHLLSVGLESIPDEFLGSVVRVSRYLATFALSPCYDVWEESGTALHTSTLACVYGGLTTAARLLNDGNLFERAQQVRIRTLESAIHHGRFVKSSENDDVDASILWLSTPFRVVEPNDSLFAGTVQIIEERLTLDGGIRRYPTDIFFGSGAWPVLTASLGWHFLAIGDLDGALRCRDWIANHFDQEGRLGEQFGGETRDPKHYEEWVERWGPPAQDLTWSHAMFVVLSVAIENFNGREYGDLQASNSGGKIFPMVDSSLPARGDGQA